MPKRDRSNQINLDLTNYPKAKKVYDELPHKNKTAWVAEAIEDKHNKESNPFTPEQEQRIIEIIRQEIKEMMK
jgi:hypothetical protein